MMTEQALCSLEWNKNYPNNGKNLYIEKTMYSAECTCCKPTKRFDSEQEAIQAWNKRIPDINIPADRLQEICAAEQEGRLLIKPCKQGDAVYCCHPGYDKESDIGEYICSGFTMDRAERWVLRCDGSWCVLNKTVFLSREAAEDALKAGEK